MQKHYLVRNKEMMKREIALMPYIYARAGKKDEISTLFLEIPISYPEEYVKKLMEESKKA